MTRPSATALRHDIDADGYTLGRLATRVVMLLRGKDQPTFTPHIDSGASVHVKNLRAVRFSGTKVTTKQYTHYSGYPGGLKVQSLGQRWAKYPERVLRDAVFGMLPSNRMRSRLMKRLTVTW